MLKDAQGEINKTNGTHYANTETGIEWTFLNQWNRVSGLNPNTKPDEGIRFGGDIAATKAIEQVALSFGGFFRSVMKHAAVLEEEIGKQALEQFHLGRIRDSCTRGVNLIYRLMILNGKMPMKTEEFELNDILRSIDPFISSIMRDDIAIQVDMTEDPLPIKGDVRFMKQAIAELILNGRDALPSGGTITLATRMVKMKVNTSDLEQGRPVEYALLSVVDTGKGIDKDIEPHIFKPFFTTKPTGANLGLGLTLAIQIVRAHKGCLKIVSRREEGTSVRMYLPLKELQNDIDESQRHVHYTGA